MTSNERDVLSHALQSLDSAAIDYWNPTGANYEAVGRAVMAKRALAEILARDTEDVARYALPGEYIDEDATFVDLCHFTYPSSVGTPLTVKEKTIIERKVLDVLQGVSGISDGDDACIRCAKRMIAEVLGITPLSRYRLMLENDVKPLYFKEYTPNEMEN